MIDWRGIYRPIQIGRRAHLDASFDQSGEKIVKVRRARRRIASDERRAMDVRSQAARHSLPDERLRYGFGLRVAQRESIGERQHVARFIDHCRATIGVTHRQARYEVQHLGSAVARETHDLTRGRDIRVRQRRVRSRPVDDGPRVVHRVHRVRQSHPGVRAQAEIGPFQIAGDDDDPCLQVRHREAKPLKIALDASKAVHGFAPQQTPHVGRRRLE